MNLAIYIRFVLSMVFVLVAYQQNLPEYVVSECYGASFNFDCGVGHQIRISKDFFGYNARNQCRSRATDCRVTNPTSTSLINRFCTGRQSCVYFQVERRGCNGVYTNYQQVEYQCVPGIKSRNICQRFFYQGAGIYVSSPEFPENYPPNLDCSCFVTTNSRSPDSKVNMQVVFMSIRHGVPCDDWLRVGRTSLCGTKVEWFTGKQIPLQFHSDAYGGHRGFWVYLEPSRPEDKIIVRCRNTTLPRLLQSIRRQQSFMRTRGTTQRNTTQAPAAPGQRTVRPFTRQRVIHADQAIITEPVDDAPQQIDSVNTARPRQNGYESEAAETDQIIRDSEDQASSILKHDGFRHESRNGNLNETATSRIDEVKTTLPAEIIQSKDDLFIHENEPKAINKNEINAKSMHETLQSEDSPAIVAPLDQPVISENSPFVHSTELLPVDSPNTSPLTPRSLSDNDEGKMANEDDTTVLNVNNFLSNIEEDTQLTGPPTEQGINEKLKDVISADGMPPHQDHEDSHDVIPTPFDVLKYVKDRLKNEQHRKHASASAMDVVSDSSGNSIDSTKPMKSKKEDISLINKHNSTVSKTTTTDHDMHVSDKQTQWRTELSGEIKDISKHDKTVNSPTQDIRDKEINSGPKPIIQMKDTLKHTNTASHTNVKTEPVTPAMTNDEHPVQAISESSQEMASSHIESNNNIQDTQRTDRPPFRSTLKTHNITNQVKAQPLEKKTLPTSQSKKQKDDVYTQHISPTTPTQTSKLDSFSDNRQTISTDPPNKISNVDEWSENDILKASTTSTTQSASHVGSTTSIPIGVNADVPSLTDYPFPPYIYTDPYVDFAYPELQREQSEPTADEFKHISQSERDTETHQLLTRETNNEGEMSNEGEVAKETNIPNLLDFHPDNRDSEKKTLPVEEGARPPNSDSTYITNPKENNVPVTNTVKSDRQRFMKEFLNALHQNRNHFYDRPIYSDLDSIWNEETFPFDYTPFYSEGYDSMYSGYMRTRYATDTGIFIKQGLERNNTDENVKSEASHKDSEENEALSPEAAQAEYSEIASSGIKHADANNGNDKSESIENDMQTIHFSDSDKVSKGTGILNMATTMLRVDTFVNDKLYEYERTDKSQKDDSSERDHSNFPSSEIDSYKTINDIERATQSVEFTVKSTQNGHGSKMKPTTTTENPPTPISIAKESIYVQTTLHSTKTSTRQLEDATAPMQIVESVNGDIMTTHSGFDSVTITKNSTETKGQDDAKDEKMVTFGLIVLGICLGSGLVLFTCFAVGLLCRKRKRRVAVAPRPALAIAHARREVLQREDHDPGRSLLIRTEPAKKGQVLYDTYARGLGHQSVLDVDHLYAKPHHRKDKGIQVDIHDRHAGVIMRPLFRIESDSDSDISLSEVSPLASVNKHSKGVQTMPCSESSSKIRGMSPPFTLRRKKIIRPQGSTGTINNLNVSRHSTNADANAHMNKQDYKPQIHPVSMGQRHVHSTINTNNKTIKTVYKTEGPSGIDDPEFVLNSGPTAFSTQGAYYKEPYPDSDVGSDWELQSVLSF